MFKHNSIFLRRIATGGLAGVGLTLLLSVTASAQSDSKSKDEQTPTVQVFTASEAITDVVWLTDTAGVQVFQWHGAPGSAAGVAVPGATWEQAVGFQPTQAMSISTTIGLHIQEVSADSPAAAAGLQVGDIISALNDVALTAEQNAGNLLSNFKPGDEITLSIKRGDPTQSSHEIRVKLGEHPSKKGSAYLGVKVGSIFYIEATGDRLAGAHPLPAPGQEQFWFHSTPPQAFAPMMPQFGPHFYHMTPSAAMPYGMMPYAMPPMFVCAPMMMPGFAMAPALPIPPGVSYAPGAAIGHGMFYAAPTQMGIQAAPGMQMSAAPLFWSFTPGMTGTMGVEASADVIIQPGQPSSPAIQVMPLPEGATPHVFFEAQVGAPAMQVEEQEVVEDEM